MQPARKLRPLGELEAFKYEEISTTTYPHFSLYSTKIFRICVAQAGGLSVSILLPQPLGC